MRLKHLIRCALLLISVQSRVDSRDEIQRCIDNLQAAIAFHTDISNVPRSAEFRAKAQKVIQGVIKYFTIPDVKNIEVYLRDGDLCVFNSDQMEDKTLFYGSLYMNNSGTGVPNFCLSNMDSYTDSISSTDYSQTAQVNLQGVIDSYAIWYSTAHTDANMMCHCFDYRNTQTTKIILWTPLSPTSLDTLPVSFSGFDAVGFKHIVMPFGFSYDDSPLWRSLVPDRKQWLEDASRSNYDVDDVIQDIWTITCRLAGKIGGDQTAEPFNPTTVTHNPHTPPPPVKYNRCINNLQAAFVFHTDISSVPRMTEFREKAAKVMENVTDYFDVPDVKEIDIDDDTCEFNKEQQRDKTLFYGSIYSNAVKNGVYSSEGTGVPSFCSSNMYSYPDTVKSANYKQASQVNLQSVVDTYTKWYNTDMKMKCHYFDYANPDTTSIILWTPLSPTSLDKGPVSFAGFAPGHFHHMVMPFGFTYDNSPLWRSLVPDESNWIGVDYSRDAADDNYSVEDIIQDIWTITCRLAGKIDGRSTAEPYNPYKNMS